VRAAVFDKNGIVGLALYWTLWGIVISIALGRSVPGILFGLALLWIVVLFLAEPLTNVLQRRRPIFEGRLAETMVQSFFELFEALIGYVSNTLSYVRLGAFAVAHAGLSMVVFMLADMLGTGPSMIVVRAIVIVLGNLAIVGFEGLIVAIQTLRLEYYELFGKFYAGEGVPFTPLVLPDIECEAMETA
jgi:V/A-type H+-transporting ATPase subunit I